MTRKYKIKSDIESESELLLLLLLSICAQTRYWTLVFTVSCDMRNTDIIEEENEYISKLFGKKKNLYLFVMCSLDTREKELVPPHGLTYPLEMPLGIHFYVQQSTVKSQMFTFKDIRNIV